MLQPRGGGEFIGAGSGSIRYSGMVPLIGDAGVRLLPFSTEEAVLGGDIRRLAPADRRLLLRCVTRTEPLAFAGAHNIAYAELWSCDHADTGRR